MATSLLAHSTLNPSSHPISKPLSSLPFLTSPARRISLRQTTKHLPFTLKHTHKPSPICSLPNFRAPTSPFPSIPIPPVDFSQVTPLTICKWAAVVSVAIAVTKKTAAILLSPFFWMYFSWTWLYWPWYGAVSLAAYGLYCLRKHLAGESSVFEQLAIVTSTITWLTLVPPAHFNGYLEGWPVAFFFVYHYFFFFESSVRKRLYGDLQPREHDPKWDVKLPRVFTVAFSALVFIGHWLAAFEAPELHMVPGGWANLGMWVLIMMVLFMRYHSVLYLANYSEKVAVPTAVVQFGPYRWVRHPIYASTMLLFAAYCVALRAPLSLLFIVAVCSIYYGQKAELEEDLMVERFGEGYEEYRRKVRCRLIPFLY